MRARKTLRPRMLRFWRRCGRCGCLPPAASLPSRQSKDDVRVKHLFVTQDYAPDLGGMARRHVELCRRFADADTTMAASTVSAKNPPAFDASKRYPINRHPFPSTSATVITNQLR